MSIGEAYRKLCENAKSAGVWYVSLYVRKPFYGGPEEGGWWGHDTELVESKLVADEDVAHALAKKVEQEADKMNVEAKQRFGEQCLRETEWLEARGLDDDFLPQPAGEDSYFVVVENTPGEHAYQGCRHYE